jgi:hypothetical protein
MTGPVGKCLVAHLNTATVQTSKSAVSRVSKPAKLTNSVRVPTWKSAIQQVGNLRYRLTFWRRIVTVPRHTQCLLALIAGCARVHAAEVDITKLPPAAATNVDFVRDISPILENNCLRCHGPEKSKSKFRLDNREAALKGGEGGVDILPGKSAQSPLIHYVTHLVADMEMPPIGKGDQLTSQQVSLLRAWIDQGAVWGKGAPTNNVAFTASPIFGGTAVSGDNQKSREQYWQKDGVNGGLEKFELFEQTSPDTKVLATGHVLLDDYKLDLSVDRNDVGFIHSGWEEYRKYFDDTGGFDPVTAPAAPKLGEDLYLDIGKAWVDFGLTLPNWPRMTLGYEYDYRQGNEATLEWNAVGTNPNTERNIGPNSQTLNEDVHIIKFDLDEEISGVSIEDRFRGEFYKLSTAGTNASSGNLPQSVREGTTYFQGANTITASKKFNDWFFGSAGYLFSKMNADSSVTMDAPTLYQVASAPRVTLEKESNIGNVNGLIGPSAGFVISMGAQAEWTRQNGFGDGTLEEEVSPFTVTNTFIPFLLASRYDKASAQENLSVRYSKIPFTAVYAEARLEQQDISQYDQFSSSQNILNKAVFLQHTDFFNQTSNIRFGFDTSPWQMASLSAYYRRIQDDSEYDSSPLVQPIATAYPTFLLDRQIINNEFETKLVLHLTPRLKTSFSYQYQSDDYGVTTRPYSSFGNIIAPGGELIAGEDHANIFSVNSTWTPIARLYLSGTFSYQASVLVTPADSSGVVAPYRGDVYTALANGTYVLTKTTDLFAGLSFSDADYAQNNYADGLPLGIEYQRRSVQLGLSRKFGKNVSAKLQYRYDYYNEPSSGGADNFRAQSVFGVVTYRFW